MKCLNCDNISKNKYCSNKCQRDFEMKQNPINGHSVKCHNCNKDILVFERDKTFPSKEKYYCSRSCANSRKWDDAHKKKLSDVCKNSDKIKLAGKLSAKKRVKEKIEVRKCPICNKEIDIFYYNRNRIYCSKECYYKDEHNEYRSGGKGGYRFGSKKKHSGKYKGYWCDSSWELAFVIYNLEHNVKFERNLQDFKYVHNNIERKYYPDFIMEDGNYLEIKGYFRNTDILKIEQFPHKLEVLDKVKMKPILKYVKSKYGTNFINLYENNIE